MHPGLQRAWLQTGGPAVLPAHAIFRQAFDQVDRIEYLGNGCAKLFDPTGAQIGILQFQGASAASVDKSVLDELHRAVDDEPARKPDPAAGDTVIRPLDMSDPLDRELVRLGGAITGVSDRDDPPPIDLPDFDHNGQRQACYLSDEGEVGGRVTIALVVAAFVVVVLALFAMVYLVGAH